MFKYKAFITGTVFGCVLGYALCIYTLTNSLNKMLCPDELRHEGLL